MKIKAIIRIINKKSNPITEIIKIKVILIIVK